MIATSYFESIQLIERLHRRFLDVVTAELNRHNVKDVNNIQAMILYNIGDDDLTVGELTLRGYYQGSNVSYNVKEMAKNGYIVQERSVHDKRSVRVRLTDKGKKLSDIMGKMFQRHDQLVREANLTKERLDQMNATLKHIERFWVSQSSFTGLDTLDDDF